MGRHCDVWRDGLPLIHPRCQVHRNRLVGVPRPGVELVAGRNLVSHLVKIKY